MAKAFQRQRANEVIGVFVLLTVGILITAVALGPNTRRWLTPTHKLTVRLPPEGSLGLRKGADVLILGTVVGSVDEITVSDAGEMEAAASVRGRFYPLCAARFPGHYPQASRDRRRHDRNHAGQGRGTARQWPDHPGTADKAPTQMLEETLADIRSADRAGHQRIRAAPLPNTPGSPPIFAVSSQGSPRRSGISIASPMMSRGEKASWE